MLPIQTSQVNIFIVFATGLSLGFPGIIESIPHINWKYYAIVSPQSFYIILGKQRFVFLVCLLRYLLSLVHLLIYGQCL
ncbi:hypothetical protein Holit_02873 [Hollandina sp. SP2]